MEFVGEHGGAWGLMFLLIIQKSTIVIVSYLVMGKIGPCMSELGGTAK